MATSGPTVGTGGHLVPSAHPLTCAPQLAKAALQRQGEGIGGLVAVVVVSTHTKDLQHSAAARPRSCLVRVGA